ncbi:MAG: alpha/beta fold hydrolase [Dehalococcoidia bacterium]|nr:alpha/beta fold hydrolase [Dehalococcoidia bacterium]
MPHAELNGTRIYYEDEGDGFPLLLISGLGANRLSWTMVKPPLLDRFRCITFDNRGTGRSEVPPGPYTIDQMADDASALLDHLGLHSVDCVGWSLGGSVLQSLLINHGDRINRAVLLSALPAYTDIQHRWLDALTFMRRNGLDDEALGVIGMPWAMTPRVMTDHVRRYEMVQLMRTANPEPTSFEGFYGQAEAIRAYDSRRKLPDVTRPVLVLVGAEDILTPVSQSVEIASLIPGATLVVLPRGGHGMVVEYPEDTITQIRAFLSQPQEAGGPV